VKRAAAFVLLVLVAGACADPTETKTTTGGLPEALEIRCDGETTDVLSAAVQARTDGVHLVIHNTSGHELYMQSASQGQGLDPGETELSMLIPPGHSRFRCLAMSDDLDPGAEGGWANFEVVAPEDWVSPTLDCPGGKRYWATADYVEGARGVADPLADAPKRFREEGDRVVQAGYATPDQRTFVLLRDEEPIAGLNLSLRRAGWLAPDGIVRVQRLS
jgi:hypothetical protein